MSIIFDQKLEMNLHQIATFLKADVKQQLIDDGHRATGDLVNSINTAIIKGVDSWVIEGSMLKYGEYVIRGREAGAKGVPIDALVKWIENKNFSDGIISTRGLAFVIQKSIKKKGIKPSDFIDKVFEKDRDLIGRKLDNAVFNALDASLRNLITNAKSFA